MHHHLGKQKGISCNIRRAFNDTHFGIKRKDEKVIDVPPETHFPPVFAERVVNDNGRRGGGVGCDGRVIGRERGRGRGLSVLV